MLQVVTIKKITEKFCSYFLIKKKKEMKLWIHIDYSQCHLKKNSKMNTLYDSYDIQYLQIKLKNSHLSRNSSVITMGVKIC